MEGLEPLSRRLEGLHQLKNDVESKKKQRE